MNDLQIRKMLFSVFALLAILVVSSGCCKKHQLAVNPFPHDGNPQGATVSIYINGMGRIFVAGNDGKAIHSKPISLPSVLEMADRKKPGWIQLLGSFTVFQTIKKQKIMLCDGNFQCTEGNVMDKIGRAVFSVNYDRNSGTLFIADASGEKVGAVEKKMMAMTHKSETMSTKGSKVSMGKLMPFAQLIERTYSSSVEKFRMLNTFIVFKIRGSQMCTIYNPITNSCYVTCIDSRFKSCAPTNGCCPPGDCP